jgi:hypothetical protein
MDDLRWDALEQTLHTTLLEVVSVAESLPEDMAHTASRNRLTMAAMHLEDARDRLAAGRSRMPKAV